MTDEFQFPSNGKAYPKLILAALFALSILVSIPFQRESLSKVVMQIADGEDVVIYVSIPFQRESLSKGDDAANIGSTIGRFNSLPTGKPIQSDGNEYKINELVDECFNSLPTGKPIQSNRIFWLKQPKEKLFQFPSNGKAYPKRPHFKPSGAVAPYAQNQTRNARDNFLAKF